MLKIPFIILNKDYILSISFQKDFIMIGPLPFHRLFS